MAHKPHGACKPYCGCDLFDGRFSPTFHSKLYDALKADGKINPPDPIDPQAVLAAAQTIIPELLRADRVAVDQVLLGEELDSC
jgi:hypothetical protein